MIINIEKLKQTNKKDFYYSEKLSDINLENMSFVMPVNVDFQVHILSNNISITGEFKAVLELECVKCLEKFQYELKGSFEAEFLKKVDYEEYLKLEAEENNKRVTKQKECIENGEVNISQLVREYIIIELPNYPSCNENCEGLEEMKNYDNRGVDPRWQKLLNIVTKK